MNTTISGERPRDAVGRWLNRIALAMAIAFMATCCWLVWRISMVAYQTEAAIVAIADDVKQMLATGATISEHLQKLDVRLQKIEDKAADAINLDEVEHMLDEVNELKGAPAAGAAAMSAETEREIKHLLSQIRRSPHRFKYSDEDKGGMRFYLQLYTKYKTYEKLLASSEDFIEKVGTQTVGGHTYNVAIDDTQSVALSEWLAEELKKYREAGSSAGSSEP